MSQDKMLFDLDRLIAKIKTLSDGESVQNKMILHETIGTVVNVVLNAVVKGVAKAKMEDITLESRIEIASKLSADINECIIPIHNAISERDHDGVTWFDCTKLAQNLKAITEDLEMQVESSTDEDGVQKIQVSIGKGFEMPEDLRDAVKSMMLGNQVGKA